MTWLPFAHAGHWLAQLAYLAPLVVLIGMLIASRLRERRERRAARARLGADEGDATERGTRAY